MKWIVLGLCISVLPAQAAQQYTESACILLKQQVNDYKRRLGANSFLYTKAKANFDTSCQNPIVAKPSGIVLLSNQQIQPQAVPIKFKSVPQQQMFLAHAQPISTQPNPFSQLFNMLIPMIVLLFFGLMALYYFKKKLPELKGRMGERHVKKGLIKYLDDTKYTIINDVTLPLEDGGTTQIDHLVVSNFGVFVIETKNMSGWIFGNKHQSKWTQTIHRSKYPFQNPLRQNYKHTKTLAYLLDMPHEQFHSVVIFTSKAELKTKMPNNVGYLKEMMVYINSFNQEVFDHKMKLRILKLLEVIKLDQSRKTNKQHIKYLVSKNNG